MNDRDSTFADKLLGDAQMLERIQELERKVEALARLSERDGNNCIHEWQAEPQSKSVAEAVCRKCRAKGGLFFTTTQGSV